MKRLVIAFVLALLPAAAGAECLPSPEAVRAVHGQGAWSSYHHVHGHKCWFEGQRPEERHARVAARSPVPRQRLHTAPPVRTIAPEETAPRWPTTTEVAPAAAPPSADSVRQAVELYVLHHAPTLYQRAAFPVLMPEALAQAKLREAVR